MEVLTGKGGSKQQLQNQIRQQKTQEAEERLRNALLMEDDDDDDDDDDNTRIASVSSKKDQQQRLRLSMASVLTPGESFNEEVSIPTRGSTPTVSKRAPHLSELVFPSAVLCKNTRQCQKSVFRIGSMRCQRWERGVRLSLIHI